MHVLDRIPGPDLVIEPNLPAPLARIEWRASYMHSSHFDRGKAAEDASELPNLTRWASLAPDDYWSVIASRGGSPNGDSQLEDQDAKKTGDSAQAPRSSWSSMHDLLD
jgi:hypothetical protein